MIKISNKIIFSQIEWITYELSKCFWCKSIDFETVTRMIKHSKCYIMYEGNINIGFGRVITDYTTYAYVTDIIINEKLRGKGFGSILIEKIISDLMLLELKTISLRCTIESEGIYKKIGFKHAINTENILEIENLDIYSKKGQKFSAFSNQTKLQMI